MKAFVGMETGMVIARLTIAKKISPLPMWGYWAIRDDQLFAAFDNYSQ
jgi:hypothetical protein